jgi:hypothetical protein
MTMTGWRLVRLRGTGNGKDEIQESLHCATDDETVRCFGRDDGVLGGKENRQRQKQIYGMTDKRTDNRKRPPLELYIPTHRDKAAMNGAPVRLWLIEREQATAKAKFGGLSTAQRTMRLSVALVEMTWIWGEEVPL